MNEVCIANIGLRQRRLRAALGAGSLLVAAGIVATALLFGAPEVRWLALPFVFGGSQGVLQHREKT